MKLRCIWRIVPAIPLMVAYRSTATGEGASIRCTLRMVVTYGEELSESLNEARATIRAVSHTLRPGVAERVLKEWEVLLVRRVGTVVGRSILQRVFAQRGISGRNAIPSDLPSVLEGLLESASVFLSKSECIVFAAALAESVAAAVREDEP